MPQPPNEDPNMSPLELPNPAQQLLTASELSRMPTLLLDSPSLNLRRYNAVRIESNEHNFVNHDVPEESDDEYQTPEGPTWSYR